MTQTFPLSQIVWASLFLLLFAAAGVHWDPAAPDGLLPLTCWKKHGRAWTWQMDLHVYVQGNYLAQENNTNSNILGTKTHRGI